MILHTVNKSPTAQSTFYDCLRFVSTSDPLQQTKPNAKILLIEDGVYAALKNTESAKAIQQSNLVFYAIDADIIARGLTPLIMSSIQLIDYSEFVRLVVECDVVQSWY